MKTRFVIASIVSAYFLHYLFTYTDWHFIDNVNLLIHEAGHWIFMLFGSFMHVLGGSLLQVVFPLLFVGYFYRQGDYFSASLLLFWVGQNLLNVSVYASDAILMRLPLLGGDAAGHDWNAILDMTGVLKYTKVIGMSIYTLGVAVITLAIYFSFVTAKKSNLK